MTIREQKEGDYNTMITNAIEEEMYWKIKGYGRILLLISIAVYGIGLIMLRIHKEKMEAEGDG